MMVRRPVTRDRGDGLPGTLATWRKASHVCCRPLQDSYEFGTKAREGGCQDRNEVLKMRCSHLNCVISSAAALALASISLAAADNVYVQHNLVSDVAGVADHTDPNLVNAWGIEHSPASFWWVNSNEEGLSIVYDAQGAAAPAGKPIMVTIPPPPGGSPPSAPTGIVFNPTMDFQIGPALPALFLFATEDGTISGWNSMVNPSQAVLEVNKPGAVYKGITLGQMAGHNVIYAADFHDGTVDVFDSNFQPVTLPAGAFHDSDIPAGFAPFNVKNIDGWIFVSFAKQDADQHDDVAGAGFGYVDRFSPGGVLVRRLQHGDWMNSPWAIVKAPGNFGKLSQRLLIGNFGSGQIAAFNAESGVFQGMMNGSDGKPVTIDGLWGLNFGNGTNAGPMNVLFFAAGPDDEGHGLFGTLMPANANDDDRGRGDRHSGGYR
jgi:uncharacterized protein (TIGR03118 family)